MQKLSSHFGTNLDTGIGRICSTRAALISGPEKSLPLENTPVSFIDTSVAQETKVHYLATKMGRVKGKKGFFPSGFPVRRHPLKQRKHGAGFLYSLGTWSQADYELQLHCCWWGHQSKQIKVVLLCFLRTNDVKFCFDKKWDFALSALKRKSYTFIISTEISVNEVKECMG